MAGIEVVAINQIHIHALVSHEHIVIQFLLLHL